MMQERELEREEERVQRLLEERDKATIADGGDDDMKGIEHQATLKDGAADGDPGLLGSMLPLASAAIRLRKMVMPAPSVTLNM